MRLCPGLIEFKQGRRGEKGRPGRETAEEKAGMADSIHKIARCGDNRHGAAEKPGFAEWIVQRGADMKLPELIDPTQGGCPYAAEKSCEVRKIMLAFQEALCYNK